MIKRVSAVGRKSGKNATKVPTVRDAVAGLRSVEEWVKNLREALETIDQDQVLSLKSSSRKSAASTPPVAAGMCRTSD